MADDGQVLFAGEFLQVELWRPKAKVLFVSFDHWRRDRRGFAPASPSSTVARLGFAELSIRTSHNDWFINPDLGQVRKILQNATKAYDLVRCFAFSMGGFGALLLSRPLHLSEAVLVSPQWSVFPDQAPHDGRYAREARLIDRAKADLTGRVRPGLRGVVLFDPSGHSVDRDHARLIAAAAPGLRGVAMPFFGHPATEAVSKTDAYADLWRLAHHGGGGPADYRAIRVRARSESALYQARLQAALAARLSQRSGQTT